MESMEKVITAHNTKLTDIHSEQKLPPPRTMHWGQRHLRDKGYIKEHSKHTSV